MVNIELRNNQNYQTVELGINDRNVPILKRVKPHSASTKYDGDICFNSTVKSVTPKAYSNLGGNVSTHLIQASNLNGNLFRIFISGSTGIPKGLYKLYLDIVYELPYGTEVTDSFYPIGVINLK
ncbi:MAG: hypothetical protein ACFFDF_19025 [Candidatus Odinarchaeota archaeon]